MALLECVIGIGVAVEVYSRLPVRGANRGEYSGNGALVVVK
jgi:hypothetical protein